MLRRMLNIFFLAMAAAILIKWYILQHNERRGPQVPQPLGNYQPLTKGHSPLGDKENGQFSRTVIERLSD